MIYCDFSESVYNSVKPNGPVLENATYAEVATPTVKRGFVTSKFSGLARLFASSKMVSGEMGLPVRMAARLRTCFQHLVHPLRLKTHRVASLIHAGTKTMRKCQVFCVRGALRLSHGDGQRY